MKKKTLFWIGLFAVLALGAGGYYALAGSGGTRASVYVDGELYDTYDLSAAGIPYEAIASVHTPIGLPIGAVTPEEIAVSIAAEMILVRAQQRAAKTGVPAHHCPV